MTDTLMPRAAAGYRSLLRTPGAAAFFLAAAAGRAGIAMTGLGLVWLLHARTGSYGPAGLAAAGFALAEALIGPQLARLIDRFGQPRVLPLCQLAHGAAIAGVLTSTTAAAQITAATCAGAVVPQLGALSGARWAHLLRGGRAGELPAAFALESLANATAFLLGPVLVAVLGAAGDAALASAIAAGGLPPSRPAQPGHRAVLRHHGRRGERLRRRSRGAGRGRAGPGRLRPERAAVRLGLRAAPASRPGPAPARGGHRLPDGHGAAASPGAVRVLARRGRGGHGGGGTARAGPAERPHRTGRPPGGPDPGVHLEQLRQRGWFGLGGVPRRARRGHVGSLRRARAGPRSRARPPHPLPRPVPRDHLTRSAARSVGGSLACGFSDSGGLICAAACRS